MRRAPWILALVVCLQGLHPARAEVSSEARTPAEIYERRASVADALLYVVKDLRVRHTNRGGAPPVLLLVVDAPAQMRDELGVLRDALQEAFREGTPGLRIGVLGIGAELTAPSAIPADARSALAELAFLPVPGPKNHFQAIRDAARAIRGEETEVKAIVLVSPDGGAMEEDVEKTRDDLLAADVAFYAVAPEAAFERAWEQDYTPRDLPALRATERYLPSCTRSRDPTFFHGSEVAYALLPYRWEMDLAQMSFIWVRPPSYPVPSGFGYWGLATLAHTTGGRYFIHDFTQPARGRTPNDREARRRTTLYDYSRLNLMAPDLRPRRKVLREIARDDRAQALLRIWEHLADEAAPLVGELPTLERQGGISERPAREVRSRSRPPGWMNDMGEVRKAIEFAAGRRRRAEEALRIWSAANARARTPSDEPDPLAARIEADFQLMGVHLRKVHFHWGEALAALREIRPVHVTYRRVRIRKNIIARGFQKRPGADDRGSDERNAEFAALWLDMTGVAQRYPQTPWSLVLDKGYVFTFALDVQVIEEPVPTPRGKPELPSPTPPRPAPPPAGPKPGSTTGGPTTGG